MKIEFICSNKQGQKFYGDNARDAVKAMLEGSKARSFSVAEYRDGCHKTQITFFGDTNIDPEYNCFRKSFKTRAEAQAFINS